MSDERLGKTYSYAVVVRATLPQINDLINYLNSVELKIAHKEISTEKLWIKRDAL